MVNLLPVASGKGGVGKSSFAVNLAVALAQKGKSVVLADFDFGGANLHTLLGLKNNHSGLGNFIYRQTSDFSSLLQDTGIENLSFIAGDCLYPGTANMDSPSKKRIIKALNSLEADYAILDLGAGTTYNTLDFFLLTKNSIIVTTPELTSVLNAYSFLKAAAFRFVMRQFKAKSEERLFINDYLKNSVSGTEAGFLDLLNQLESKFESAKPVKDELLMFRPQIVMNQAQTSDDIQMANRLRSLISGKLGISVDFVGLLQKDEQVSFSIALRKPLALANPGCKFVQGVNMSAGRIINHTYYYNNLNSFEDEQEIVSENTDLEELKQEFSSLSNENLSKTMIEY